MKIDNNEKWIIALCVVIIIMLVLIFRCNATSARTIYVPSQIESVTKLNVDSIETITFYASTNEVFVTMLNGDEHYCEARVAGELKYSKLGFNDTEFEVWENSDGETEIVICYE